MTTILPWDGKPISEPGIYSGVDNDLYHGQLTIEPSFSSTALRKVESESLRHWWWESYLNPNRPAEEQKEHFNLGSAVHELMLGETGFRSRYVVRPEKWDDYKKAEAREWRDEHIKAGFRVLTPKNIEQIRGIAEALQQDPFIKQGLFRGLVEHTMTWRDPETGIWLKARPDVIDLETLIVCDLKTTTSALDDHVSREIADRGYNQQIALINEGVEILTGRKVPEGCATLVFVEKTPPYAISVTPLPDDDIYLGRAQNRRSIRRIAKALETGHWPGPESSGTPRGLPYWKKRKLEEDLKFGLLPEPLKTNATETA